MTSVIIPVKDRTELTLSLLDSLLKSDSQNLREVVIIDNQSSPGAVKALKEFAWPKLKIFHAQRPLNFGESCNLGAREASGDKFVFMNNDITVPEGWLEALLSAHGAGAGVTGARLLYPDGRIQHGGETLPVWGTPFIGGTGAPGDDARYTGLRERWAVIAALMLVDRELFTRVDGFDEGYMFGLEDVDFCLKARAAGEKVACSGDLPIIHHESGTLAGLPDKKRSEWLRLNLERFAARWSGLIERLTSNYLSGMKKNGIKRVALYGTGMAGRRCLEIFRKGGIEVAAFLDTSPNGAQRKKIEDIPVKTPVEWDKDADCLIAATQSQWEVEKKLEGAGFAELAADIELREDGWKPGDILRKS